VQSSSLFLERREFSFACDFLQMTAFFFFFVAIDVFYIEPNLPAMEGETLFSFNRDLSLERRRAPLAESLFFFTLMHVLKLALFPHPNRSPDSGHSPC